MHKSTPKGGKIEKLKEISYITTFTALALSPGYLLSYIPIRI
jgi:hypothetical protein